MRQTKVEPFVLGETTVEDLNQSFVPNVGVHLEFVSFALMLLTRSDLYGQD